MIAKIILTSTKHILDREFDYRVPAELESSAQIGSQVLVPFGIHNNSVESLIVALGATSDVKRLKSIKRLIGSGPVCSDELLRLCFWMQRQYLCTFYQAFKLIVPPKMKTVVQEWVLLLEDAPDGLTPTQQLVVDFLRERDGVAEYGEIHEGLSRNGIKKSIYALRDKGILDIRERIGEGMKIRRIRKARLALPLSDAYQEAELLFARRAPVQAQMLLTLCDEGELSTADLVMTSGGNYASLASLEQKGLVEIFYAQIVREAYDEDRYTPTDAYRPTEEQQPVIDHLNGLIGAGKHEKILLRGVTGSGKTEVFLQSIDACIKAGRRAVMLVPEISLTPQMVERFVGRFGRSVAVIHSGLSYGERFDQWNKIKNGEVNVVVGARSAIFAPFDNIGIIILDEEHESSYKSEISPRYHAREIAVRRAEENNCPVLFASATPSVESYYRAESGEYRLFEMHSRFNQIALPKTVVVDMRSELFELKNTSMISLRLQRELQRNLDSGEKTILFLNRRGYNTFVSCRECGHVVECENCSIAMTYHRNTNTLTCHYCGYTIPNLTVCPECGSKYIKYFGTGTQRIEDELCRLFPQARVLRMDYDTTSGKGGHEQILNRFKNGEADILLGTQMVTKGLDFREVTLVGVLAADSALGIDDYRANERTFSLITQVCGRAGRGDLEGRAVIQTYQPQNAIISYAKQHDYMSFYRSEIKYRKRLVYPPFSDMICLLVSGEDEALVRDEVNEIGLRLRDAQRENPDILTLIGPGPAPILKIKNKFRYRILIKARQAQSLLDVLHEINDRFGGNGKNTLVIDINPINMS